MSATARGREFEVEVAKFFSRCRNLLTVTVKAVKGGLEIPAESGGDAITIANAAVIVSLDDGK